LHVPPPAQTRLRSGPPARSLSAKDTKYDLLVGDEPIQYGGLKLFYRQDEPLLSPEQVLELDLAPVVSNIPVVDSLVGGVCRELPCRSTILPVVPCVSGGALGSQDEKVDARRQEGRQGSGHKALDIVGHECGRSDREPYGEEVEAPQSRAWRRFRSKCFVKPPKASTLTKAKPTTSPAMNARAASVSRVPRAFVSIVSVVQAANV
jgi:hypothetical protein